MYHDAYMAFKKERNGIIADYDRKNPGGLRLASASYLLLLYMIIAVVLTAGHIWLWSIILPTIMSFSFLISYSINLNKATRTKIKKIHTKYERLEQ